jgi:hypothetical protein
VTVGLAASGCGGSAPVGSQPSATTTSGVPTRVTQSVSGFRGIYEFAGDNSSADAHDPYLAGVNLDYYWSQIEPARGRFDWSVIDKDMAPWVNAGKKVILRISTSGEFGWDPPYSGQGTPRWVLADGTRTIHDNGETLPVYWDRAYLTDYNVFVENLAAQFNGNRHIAFVEAGIGMGGETLPETNASLAGIYRWRIDGYTDNLWLNTVKKIALIFKSHFTKTPVYPLVDRTFFDGNGPDFKALMAWFKTLPNWGLQDDGLSSTQRLSSAWSGVPLALEQLDPTHKSGDCLCSDIANGIKNLHGQYLLIYRSDIDNPSNVKYLESAASEVSQDSQE